MKNILILFFLTATFLAHSQDNSQSAIINIAVFLNNDTLQLANNSVLKFYNYDKNDTLRIALNNQRFQVDSITKLTFNYLKILSNELTIDVYTADTLTTFADVFRLNDSLFTMTLHYYTDYKIAKQKGYIKEVEELNENNFKSLLIWDYDGYCCDVTILEQK